VKNLVLTAACLFALVACDKPSSTETKVDDPAKNTTTTTNGTAATATAAATAATPAPITIDDSVLSTPADFEETAEKAITPKTYKAELATLEADLAKD
jgi:hypothetical protein